MLIIDSSQGVGVSPTHTGIHTHHTSRMTTLTVFLVACSILIIPTGSLISQSFRSHGSIINNIATKPSFIASPHQCPSTTKTTLLHMALGGNYLDNIDNEDNNNNNNNNSNNNNGNNRWGIFGPGRGGSASSRGNNDNNQGRGGGGVGTAIRPQAPNSNYGIGGNRRQQQQQPSSNGGGGGGNGNGNGGVPRVFSIRQPQDLLDFVVEDERLSVGKSLLY